MGVSCYSDISRPRDSDIPRPCNSRVRRAKKHHPRDLIGGENKIIVRVKRVVFRVDVQGFRHFFLYLSYNVCMKRTILILLLFVISYQPHSVDALITFLKNDKTNEIPYSDSFFCVQFSITLIQNLRKNGWKAGVVWAEMSGVDHAFVAVQTNSGVIFVEPQKDTFYKNVQVGGKLCASWGCMNGTIQDYYIDWNIDK